MKIYRNSTINSTNLKNIIMSKQKGKDQFTQKIKESKTYSKLNKDEALNYRDRNSIKFQCDSNIFVDYPMSINNEEFSKFGVGLYLYFDFFKKITIMFFIMSVFALIPLIKYGSGEGIGSSEFSIQSLSIANVNKLIINEEDLNTINLSKTEEFFNSNLYLSYISNSKSLFDQVVIIDLIYTLLFLEFIKYLKNRSKNIKSESKYLFVSSYALEVSGFPNYIRDEKTLRKHFEKFGSVVECKLARDYFGVLRLKMLVAQDEFKYRMEEKRCERNTERKILKKTIMFRKLMENDKKITQILEKKSKLTLNKIEDYPSKSAFVIFQDKKIADFIRNEYKKQRLLRSVLTCRKSEISPCLLFKQKFPLKIKFADKPSNIKWENIDVPYFRKLKNRILVFVSVLLLLILTFFLLTMVIAFQSINTKICASTKSKTFIMIQEKINNSIDCWCLSQSYFQMLTNSNTREKCSHIFSNKTMEIFINFLCTIIIIMINYGLRKLLQSLQSYCLYNNKTEESISLFNNLFLATFINTSFLITFVYADIFNFKPMKLFGSMIPSLFENDIENLSNDFDSEWYKLVGTKILIFSIFQIFLPHLISTVMTFAKRKFILMKISTVLLQRDLNALLLGESFDLTLKYTRLLSVIFICFLYSSGMPILIIIGAFTLLVQYLFDKYYILRFCKRPIVYDDTLHKLVIDKIFILIILHLCIGIYAYGTPNIFPNEVGIFIFNSFKQESGLNDRNEGLIEEILRRLAKSLPLTILLIYSCIYFFSKFTIIQFVKKIKKILLKRKIHDINFAPIKTFTENKNKRKFHDIDSYDIKKNPVYLPLIEDLETFFIKGVEPTPIITLESHLSRRFSIPKIQKKNNHLILTKENNNLIENDSKNHKTSIESSIISRIESHCENYWDLNNIDFRSELNKEESKESIQLENSKDLEKNDENDQRIIISEENRENNENLQEKDTKILEFLGENNQKDQIVSPIRTFSILKHSLMNNITKKENKKNQKKFFEIVEPLKDLKKNSNQTNLSLTNSVKNSIQSNLTLENSLKNSKFSSKHEIMISENNFNHKNSDYFSINSHINKDFFDQNSNSSKKNSKSIDKNTSIYEKNDFIIESPKKNNPQESNRNSSEINSMKEFHQIQKEFDENEVLNLEEFNKTNLIKLEKLSLELESDRKNLPFPPTIHDHNDNINTSKSLNTFNEIPKNNSSDFRKELLKDMNTLKNSSHKFQYPNFQTFQEIPFEKKDIRILDFSQPTKNSSIKESAMIKSLEKIDKNLDLISSKKTIEYKNLNFLNQKSSSTPIDLKENSISPNNNIKSSFFSRTGKEIVSSKSILYDNNEVNSQININLNKNTLEFDKKDSLDILEINSDKLLERKKGTTLHNKPYNSLENSMENYFEKSWKSSSPQNNKKTLEINSNEQLNMSKFSLKPKNVSIDKTNSFQNDKIIENKEENKQIKEENKQINQQENKEEVNLDKYNVDENKEFEFKKIWGFKRKTTDEDEVDKLVIFKEIKAKKKERKNISLDESSFDQN